MEEVRKKIHTLWMRHSSGSESEKRRGLPAILLMVVYMFFILVVAVIVVVIAYIVKSFSGESDEERPAEELDVTFHPHAISRMEERDIDPDRVMELITGEGRKVGLAHHNRIKVTDGEITAVIGKGLRKLEVITVYWNDGQRGQIPHG